MLDKIRLRVSEKAFPFIVGRVSFFVNAGIKFISEICKMRAFVELWNEICLVKYGVKEEKFRRFRYGVQVNSLGLTEQQPENNVYRILLELLAVTLSKNARARAIQLPAWNEAMGLPRPWDQQWSLRIQQVLAYETDLLEYEDIFDQNPVINQKVKKIIEQVKFRTEKIEKMGGTVAALDYMKRALVSSNSNRLSKIENGETTVVGVNKFTTTEESGLSSGKSNNVQVVDREIEKVQISSLLKWKEERDDVLVQTAIERLKDAARKKVNIMPASIEAAKAGVSTGEWADTMRGVFGEFRAPQGSLFPNLQIAKAFHYCKKGEGSKQEAQTKYKSFNWKARSRRTFNGAEQIAMRAKEAGFDVVYQGIPVLKNQIVNSALEEAVHIIGLSILSGSHLEILEDLTNLLKTKKMTKIPVIVGGIIPEQDFDKITKMGVRRNLYSKGL